MPYAESGESNFEVTGGLIIDEFQGWGDLLSWAKTM